VEEWPDDGTNARCFGLLRDMRLTGVLGRKCPAISTIHPERTTTETNKVSMPSRARVLASKKAPLRRDVSASMAAAPGRGEDETGSPRPRGGGGGQVKVGDWMMQFCLRPRTDTCRVSCRG
jgi:hypothetical protein